MRRRKLAWIASALLAGGIAVGYGPDVWWWATHERVHFFTWHDDFAGWWTMNRFTEEEEGETRFWHIETGRLVTLEWTDAREERSTYFDEHDGRIISQEWVRTGEETFDERTEPPWWWGAEPRTTPDAPWTLEGITFYEWAQRLLAQGRK